MDDALLRIAYHEAGHQVVAQLRGWPATAVTVAGGSAWAGCCGVNPPPVPGADQFDADLPFVLWPAPVRAHIETDALMTLAGAAAEALLLRRSADPVAQQGDDEAVSVAPPLPEPTGAERAWALRAVDNAAAPDDEERAEAAAVAAFAYDIASRHQWLALMQVQAEAIVRAHATLVGRFAERLAEQGTLSAEASALLLRRGGLGVVTA